MRILSLMMKWSPTVMMKQKMSLTTTNRRWNHSRIGLTKKQRKPGSRSKKTVHGKSKPMTDASMNNLSL